MPGQCSVKITMNEAFDQINKKAGSIGSGSKKIVNHGLFMGLAAIADFGLTAASVGGAEMDDPPALALF